MALAVEQFTAPGKFYIDKFFEEKERELKNIGQSKNSKSIYIGLLNAEAETCLFKENPYYNGLRDK